MCFLNHCRCATADNPELSITVLVQKPLLIIGIINGFFTLKPLLILLKPEFQVPSYSKIAYIIIHIQVHIVIIHIQAHTQFTVIYKHIRL
jgi:hypothetical protein